MQEIWKDIEGLYQVSNFGRVKSLEKICKSCYNATRISKEKILKNRPAKNGYYRVVLYKDGNAKDYYVHRLVAENFIKNIKSMPVINHKDGNKKNNKVDNLEWCTHKENTRHAWENNLIIMTDEDIKRNIINGIKQSKKVIQYDKSGTKIAEYNSLMDAERSTSVGESSIVRCCKGKNKTAGGYIWKYKEE